MADRYVSSLASGSGNGTLGSPWTFPQAASGASSGDVIKVMNDGAYTISANLSFAQNSIVIIGVNASGVLDGSRFTLTASGSTTAMIALTGFWARVANAILDCANVANYGISSTIQEVAVRNVRVTRYVVSGIKSTNARLVVKNSEIDNGKTGATAAIELTNSSANITSCYIHDNAGVGVSATSTGNVITDNLIVANTSHGVSVSFSNTVSSNTIASNGGDGIRITSTGTYATEIERNLLVSNGGYGINVSAGTAGTIDGFAENAFYNNASGARNNNAAGTGDITLSATPFVGSGDYSLNADATGGALCRGVARTIPGTAVASYGDIGCVQHRDVPGVSAGRLFGGM